VKPGMKEVELFYSPAGLDLVEGKVPSPEGFLTVRWDLNGDRNSELDVEVPGKMLVKLNLASLDVPPGKQILINGQPIFPDGDSTSFFIMSEGSHKVEF
jgi:P pilus assembly chaperone PapD